VQPDLARLRSRPRPDGRRRDRLSIGTQSLRAEQLKFLGRLHDPAGARAPVGAAIEAGVARVSTDLIFGLPGESVEDARYSALHP